MKISRNAAIMIVHRLLHGEDRHALAREFGISYSQVCQLWMPQKRTGKAWRDAHAAAIRSWVQIHPGPIDPALFDKRRQPK